MSQQKLFAILIDNKRILLKFDVSILNVCTVPCKKAGLFRGFQYSYKIPIDERVETYPKVMINASIFAQLIVLPNM